MVCIPQLTRAHREALPDRVNGVIWLCNRAVSYTDIWECMGEFGSAKTLSQAVWAKMKGRPAQSRLLEAEGVLWGWIAALP